MRQDFIEFSNETKIVLMTNHLPEIKGDDYAMWRRIRHILKAALKKQATSKTPTGDAGSPW